jgi:soluble lytic murein transglycosylase-like protein
VELRLDVSWQSLSVFLLSLLVLALVLLGREALQQVNTRAEHTASAIARLDRKVQQLEAGITFDSRRRQLLLGMRNHILEANPHLSLAQAWRYAELALAASDKYPAVDPLLLVAIGIVESGYDPGARSPADARGLYQIWPSTGRLLARSLGWTWDESMLYDPEKNTEAAALYLDMLFATYNDPRLVLAEYNGGPLNARYFRASAAALAHETRDYVPRVIALHDRLEEEFATGMETAADASSRSRERVGKSLDEAPGPAHPEIRAEASGPGRSSG